MTKKSKQTLKWGNLALFLLLFTFSFTLFDSASLPPHPVAVKQQQKKPPQTYVEHKEVIKKISKTPTFIAPLQEYTVESLQPNQHIFDNNLCTSDNLRANYKPALKEEVQSLSYDYKHYVYQINQYISLNLYAKQLSKRFERRLIKSIAFIHKNYTYMLGNIAKRKIELHLVIAPSRHQYDTHYFKYSAKSSNTTLGVYFGGLNIAFIDYQASDDKALKTAVHETVHAFNAHILGKTPRMFNEGMAELYEDIKIEGDTGTLAISPERLNKEPLPIMQFFDQKQWPHLNPQDLYYSSWAFIVFMRSDNIKKQSLINFMKQEQLTPCVAFSSDEAFTLLSEDNSMFEIEFYQWQTDIMNSLESSTAPN